MSNPRMIWIDHRAAAGDTVVLTGAIKALHETHPGAFLTFFGGHHGMLAPPGNNLVAHNPYITPLDREYSEYINLDYGYGINHSGRPRHFLDAFVEHLSLKLGVYIELKDYRGDIYLSEEEKKPFPGLPDKYAIIDAGYKRDFTAKHWSSHRYQAVIDATKDRIAWVQIGSASDNHTILNNCVNMVGQTTLRDLCSMIYRCSLVLTPVSLPMHLAAAVPNIQDGPRLPPESITEAHERHARGRLGAPMPPRIESLVQRPCIVLMGQREQRHWEAYPSHVCLGTTGKLECGIRLGEACWRNKTIKLANDGDTSLCFNPKQDEVGSYTPECLHRVSVEEVVGHVESFL